MPLMCFSGGLGTGKTLSAVYGTLRHFIRHKRIVFSNIKLYNIPYYQVDSFEDLNKIRGDNEREAVALLDELWTYVQARVSKSIVNRVANLILLKSRKRETFILYTAQEPRSIDRYIRNITDYVAYPFLSADGLTCRIMIFVNNFGKLTPSNEPPWEFETIAVYPHYNSWEEAPDFQFKDSFELSLRFEPIWTNPALIKGMREFEKKQMFSRRDLELLYNYYISMSCVTSFNMLTKIENYLKEEEKKHILEQIKNSKTVADWVKLPEIKIDESLSFSENLSNLANKFMAQISEMRMLLGRK